MHATTVTTAARRVADGAAHAVAKTLAVQTAVALELEMC